MRGGVGRRSREEPPGTRVLAADAASEEEACEQLCSCCLTFELTPTAEAGGVSPVTDDATDGGRRAYDACRSGSGAERGVRRHYEL